MSACAAYGCKNRPHNKIPGITFHKFPKDIALRNKWLLALRRVNFQPTAYSRLCSEHFSEDLIDRTSLACVRLKANAVPNIFAGYPKHFQKKSKQILSFGNKSVMRHKQKSIAEEEDQDCMSDEGLNKCDKSDIHSDDEEQVNGCSILLTDKSYSSESSNETNKNGLSCHPNILRIIPANVSTNVSISKIFSNSDLNPDFIDALTSSQTDSSIPLDSNDTTTSSTSNQTKLSNEIILQRKVQQFEIMNLSYKKKIKLLQQQNRRQKAKIDALENRIKELEANKMTDEDVSEDYISEDEIYEELLKHQRENNEISS